jgi:hypothetical protein
MMLRSTVIRLLMPVWVRLRYRIEVIAREVVDAERSHLIAAARGERDALRAELGELRGHVDRVAGEIRGRLDEVTDQLRLMGAQVAATDERVGELERPPVVVAGDDGELAEAGRLVEEIRREHGRARSRLAAIAFYEERIARLERRADDAADTGRCPDPASAVG